MFSKTRYTFTHLHRAGQSRSSARRNETPLRIESIEKGMLRSRCRRCSILCLALITATLCSAQVNTANGQGNKGGKPAAAGISVSTTVSFSASSFFTTELGRTADFRVVLDSQPSADVTINLISSDTSEGNANVPWLIFTPNNWNSPQTVVVIGADDMENDGTVGYWIDTEPAYSDDPNYDSLDADDVLLSNIDDESSVANAIYVRDFAMETRRKGPSTEIQLFVDVRTDTNADGVSEDIDSPAADAVVVISIYDSNGTNVRNIVGTTGAQGTGTTYWYKLSGTGEYHIEVHDVSLDGFYWDPLDVLESSLGDEDWDGRPDLQISV